MKFVRYNNIERRDPKVTCGGGQVPANKLAELLRAQCAQAGYTEALTFTLVST
jgi:phenylalanyl-tRNA synthetase beta chain